MMLPNGWKKVKLGDILTAVDYGTAAKSDAIGKYPVLRMGNLENGYLVWDDLVYSSSEEEYAKYELKKGDILFNRTNSRDKVGKTSIYRGERPSIFAGYLIRLKVNNECDPYYVNYCMNSKRFAEFCKSVRTDAIGQSNINAQVLQTYDFSLPPIEEQKKIAATLSVWDSAIEKMEKLIDAKEKSFNSLLKELIYFPAESERWNIVKLGDVSEMSSGGTPKSSIEKYYNGDVLWVSIADMTEQGMYIKDTAKKLTKLGIENSAAKIYPKGTVLYAMYASIGEVSIAKKEMASSQAILGIQVSDKLVNKYLYYFLVGQKERIKLQGQVGTQSNLNAGMVKNLDIPIPSIKEQNKIIAVLDNGMDELSLLKQQLENYKKQKQGLMQKLLTGQWRVK